MGLIRRILGIPDQDDFAEITINAFRKNGDDRVISYDPNEFKLVIEGQNSFQFFLNNAYQEYRAAKRSQRASVLKKYIGLTAISFVGLPDNFDEARIHILPRVRNHSYYGINRLRFQDEDKPLNIPNQPLSEHLAVGLAFDGPESIMEVPAATLEQWQRPFDEVLELARDNLWNISKGKFQQISPGLFISPWQDNHDAARLFLYDLLWHLDVNGEHVAAIPNRDTLIVTGSEDIPGLTAMASVCQELIEQPRAISGVPVILKEKKWQTFMPERHSPVFDLFNKLRVFEAARDYGEQKQLLDALHDKHQQEIFAASFTIVQNKETQQLNSYAVWAQGITTLLPQTDEIFFVDSNKQIVARGNWSQVIEIVGHRLHPTDLRPVRYKVLEFPTSDELARFDQV